MVGERQHERTPLATAPERLGAYAWGKCLAESLVTHTGPRLGIEACIVRPGALIDGDHPEVPGLLGRRVYGRWHLGFGRPSVPLAVIDVHQAASAIAWCAHRFEDAPRVVNLMDSRFGSRGELLRLFRGRGWRGRVVWLPIPLVAALVTAARTVSALVQRRRPRRLAVWAVLRARRYDPQVASRVLGACAVVEAASRQSDRPQPVAG
ncbi:MAG: hypothetical protein ACRD08_20960, partial [Acidimicrobiales bacterium]